MRTLGLCGAGNVEAVRLVLTINAHRTRWDRLVLLDDDATLHGRSMLGVEIAGSFAVLAELGGNDAEVANLVARTAARRRAAHAKIDAYGVPFTRLVHPGVDTAGAELGEGVIIYQGATIGPDVALGNGSVCFMNAVVGHRSRVGTNCIVAPGAVINARVRLEDDVYVGTNASILPELTIGRGATIAAGSVAVQDVPEGATVIGVPGRVLDLFPKPARHETNGVCASAAVRRGGDDALGR